MIPVQEIYQVIKDLLKEYSDRRRSLFPLPWVHASPPGPSPDFFEISTRWKTQGFLVGVSPGVKTVSYLVLTSIGQKNNSIRYIDLVSGGRKKVYPVSTEWLSYISTIGYPISIQGLQFGGDVKKLVKRGEEMAKALRLKIQQGNFIIRDDDESVNSDDGEQVSE